MRSYDLSDATNITTTIQFINLYNVINDNLLCGVISLIINYILLKKSWYLLPS